MYSIFVLRHLLSYMFVLGVGRHLKVLSNEIDPAEIRFIRKIFIKERGAEVFRKICPSAILREPFKATATPRTAVGYFETIANAGMKIHCAAAYSAIASSSFFSDFVLIELM
jgi:hypothetical protein